MEVGVYLGGGGPTSVNNEERVKEGLIGVAAAGEMTSA